MIFVHFTPTGQRRVADLQTIFAGQSAMLVGGAPSLLEQPVELLNKRGVLSMAMNNAATHFQPTLWASGDNPNCYDPQILLDPRIMKFAPLVHAQLQVAGRKYFQMPNVYFYIQDPAVPWDEFFGHRQGVPWFNNTLFVSFNILYHLGVRRIILAGSDFGFSTPAEGASEEGQMYAHKTDLGTLERKWNLDLYNSQVKELRLLKPVFERAGLQLLDASKNSRIKQAYPHVTLDKAVEICLAGYPKEPADTSKLPHCSKFAPDNILDKIGKWPGHQLIEPMKQNSLHSDMKQVI